MYNDYSGKEENWNTLDKKALGTGYITDYTDLNNWIGNDEMTRPPTTGRIENEQHIVADYSFR